MNQPTESSHPLNRTIKDDLAVMSSRPAVGHPAFTGVEFKPSPDGLPEVHEPHRPMTPQELRAHLGAISTGNPDYDPLEKPVVIEPKTVAPELEGGSSPVSGYGEFAN